MKEFIEIFWPNAEEIAKAGSLFVGIAMDGNDKLIESFLDDPRNKPPQNSFAYLFDEGTPKEQGFVCFREGTPAYRVFDQMRKEGAQHWRDEKTGRISKSTVISLEQARKERPQP